MNLQPPTQEQLANFQEQMNRMQHRMASIWPTQSSTPSSSSVGPSSLASAAGSSHDSIMAVAVPAVTAPSSGGRPFQLQPLTEPSFTGPITPYQSPHAIQGLPASQGHPSTVGVVSASATQPFLGFNSTRVNLTGQVNQARLASSAATQPWGPDFQTCRARWVRGPAVAPPSLPIAVRPDARRCVTEVFPSEGPAYIALKLTIKVYPPQVCLILFFNSTTAKKLMIYHRSSPTRI
jgi:hypothetical protein